MRILHFRQRAQTEHARVARVSIAISYALVDSFRSLRRCALLAEPAPEQRKCESIVCCARRSSLRGFFLRGSQFRRSRFLTRFAPRDAYKALIRASALHFVPCHSEQKREDG